MSFELRVFEICYFERGQRRAWAHLNEIESNLLLACQPKLRYYVFLALRRAQDIRLVLWSKTMSESRCSGTSRMVPRAGVEPAREKSHYVLNVARLPFRHRGRSTWFSLKKSYEDRTIPLFVRTVKGFFLNFGFWLDWTKNDFFDFKFRFRSFYHSFPRLIS